MIAGSPTIVTGTLRYARDMVPEVAHPSIGLLSVLGIPVKLSETPGAMRTARLVQAEAAANDAAAKEALGDL